MVSGSPKQKCGLKYVIHSLGGHEKSGAEAPHGIWKGESATPGDSPPGDAPFGQDEACIRI
jgi:hypothetical protein